MCNRQNMFKRHSIFFILILAFFCLNKSHKVFAQEQKHEKNKHSWVRITNIESVGFSQGKLNDLRAYCKTISTTGLMGIYKGKVFFEYGDIKRVSYIASVRKSVLSMIYGKYTMNGKIDLNKSLESLDMDDHGGLLPIERRATITHLISAKSGVYHLASNPGDNLLQAPERGSKEPGTYYLYSNWDFNAAGAAFELTTGKNIFDVVQQELAIPLGMEDFHRSRHEKGGNLDRSKYSSYHMHFSTRDMAKLGQLMLDNGLYKGRQIIPKEWVRKSVSIITPPKEMNPDNLRNGEFGYGYMWWVWAGNDIPKELKGAYTAMGYAGQFITVIPTLNMVIAHKTVLPQRVSISEYKSIVEQLIDSKLL